MLKHYKLRITLTQCNLTSVLALLNKQCKQWAYVQESGKLEEKPHIHAYVVSSIKEDTLRTQYRALSKSSRGNKLYSLVKLSLEDSDEYAVEYLAYMMKEGSVVLQGIPTEWFDKAKLYDDLVKKEIKEKKEKKKSRTQRIFESFEKDRNARPDLHLYENMAEVIDWVVMFFVKEKVGVSVSTISTWTNTLMLQYDIAHHRTGVAGVVMRQLTVQ